MNASGSFASRLILLLAVAWVSADAQNSSTSAQQGPPSSPSQTQTPAAANPPQPEQATSTFEPKNLRAWSLLTEFAAPGKSPHDRVQAMAALGTMGQDERAAHLIEEGIGAKDPDVQIASILAAKQTGNPHLVPRLQAALDDEKPEVAYAAAMTLWKMHDLSGRDLLTAVAEGDRKAKPGLIRASKHKAVQDLHSPKTLTLLAVNGASGFFLGPFGVGIKAIEYVNKSSGASVRGAAVDEIAQEHTEETRNILIDLLNDDEPAVRAAAAKGLGRWTGDEGAAQQLEPLFGDNNLAVRLTAAAAYLRIKNKLTTPTDCSCDSQ